MILDEKFNDVLTAIEDLQKEIAGIPEDLGGCLKAQFYVGSLEAARVIVSDLREKFKEQKK